MCTRETENQNATERICFLCFFYIPVCKVQPSLTKTIGEDLLAARVHGTKTIGDRRVRTPYSAKRHRSRCAACALDKCRPARGFSLHSSPHELAEVRGRHNLHPLPGSEPSRDHIRGHHQKPLVIVRPHPHLARQQFSFSSSSQS